MSECKTRITKLTVTPGELFHERGFTVEIVDESGGEFIEVSSNETGEPLRVDADEWPFLRDAIDRMFREIEENEGKPEPPKEEGGGSDGWIPWEGGECPVDPTIRVEYQVRDGYVYERVAGKLRWYHSHAFSDFREDDIIAYKVVD